MLNCKLLCQEETIIICAQENVTIRVKQSLPFHPLTHVQVSGAVQFLLVPHVELQIAMLRVIICPQENVTIRVKQSLPFHPLIHVQVSGAVQFLLVPHVELQVAVLRGNNNYMSTNKCNHTC